MKYRYIIEDADGKRYELFTDMNYRVGQQIWSAGEQCKVIEKTKQGRR